ncbi:Hypothetical predicted protein [Paramuricea clavata]|uniref:Uncharacterized protein n=1 Tax=Paramuricea clavata TaxID=317549 RepID=A0A6S7FR38_PARCT|nr:Hypothetical predicted protein [Paramuricea clavata]
MSEQEAKKTDDYLDSLLMIAKSNVVNDHLETLKNLPRAARGFRIKADLKMSTNGRGVGVFAAEFLSAGTRIETDRVHTAFTREQAYAFLEAAPNDEQRKWWLEHIYCLDVTREDGFDYTTRDVNIGEELTEDYRTYEMVPYYEELCKKYGVEGFSDEWK